METGHGNGRPTLEGVGRQIFEDEESPDCRRWVRYWKETEERTRRILADFEAVILLDMQGKRVLDLGCGTGSLGREMSARGACYTGLDYHRHVLQFAPETPGSSFVQGSGLTLPFPDHCLDLILAFDVIEHLTGGNPWQRQFLAEMHRVLAPEGMILLTTPNFWHPYDAHSGLYFPHYLPSFLRDSYVQWKNPGFLREHSTFGNIRLLRPGFLKKAIEAAHLRPLHELPCCLDRSEYRQLHPVKGFLAYIGLGWLLHVEFWMILGRSERHRQMRRRLRKCWSYEHSQPGCEPPRNFAAHLDFDRGPSGHQLGAGWFWHEPGEPSFRWTGASATCYLQSQDSPSSITISGFSAWENQFELFVEGIRVGKADLPAQQLFDHRFLLPYLEAGPRLLEVEIRCRRTFRAEGDQRDLGVMIFRLGLEE